MTTAHTITALGYLAIPALILLWIARTGGQRVAPVPALWLFAWFITACALDHLSGHGPGHGPGHGEGALAWVLAWHEVAATWTTVIYLAAFYRRDVARHRARLLSQRAAIRSALESGDGAAQAAVLLRGECLITEMLGDDRRALREAREAITRKFNALR